MNIKVKVEHLKKMLDALQKKTGYSSGKDLVEIAAKLGLENHQYIYKYIHLEVNKHEPNDMMTVREALFRKILLYIGFKDYNAFKQSLEQSINAQLLSCEGSYYSYVRRNSEEIGILFRSPVKMWVERNELKFELHGPSTIFSGTVRLRHDCMFILMEAPDGGKAFHHIYKLGTRKRPNVLQGIFSGVSTAFHPIGGRTVLIRHEQPYEKLKNAELEINKIKKSKILEERRLAYYFEKYFNNNVKSDISSTFGLGDLGNCK